MSIAGQEIALTREGDQGTGLSPMTADRAADDNSIASSIGSPSIGSVVETDEVIKGMMVNDVKETGDGGELDEDGEGFDVVTDFAEACIGSMRDRQMITVRLRRR